MNELTIIIRNGKLEVACDGKPLELLGLALEYRTGAPLLVSVILPPEPEAPGGSEYIS